MAETKTKPTGASVDAYFASRASPEQLDLDAAGRKVDAARGRFRTRAALDLVLPELEERVQGASPQTRSFQE